jgi:hypothetical protein
MEQLNITNDETIYLWYRRNVTLTATYAHTLIKMEIRRANAYLFFLDGQYLGEYDTHNHEQGSFTTTVALDFSRFKLNEKYLFEILSISLGIANGVSSGSFEHKGIVGKVWINDQLLINDETNLWEHQKGLMGEYFQIYTEQGSSKVNWNTEWMTGINRPITWFQTRFDLDHLIREDLNANPVLFHAQGLNRGHVFVNGNDLGLYWMIEGICEELPSRCHQSQVNCLEPIQRYYHIPSDWLMPRNNLLTVFEDLGAPSPGSVELVQRIVTM